MQIAIAMTMRRVRRTAKTSRPYRTLHHLPRLPGIRRLYLYLYLERAPSSSSE
jgi:hypothetical protein